MSADGWLFSLCVLYSPLTIFHFFILFVSFCPVFMCPTPSGAAGARLALVSWPLVKITVFGMMLWYIRTNIWCNYREGHMNQDDEPCDFWGFPHDFYRTDALHSHGGRGSMRQVQSGRSWRGLSGTLRPRGLSLCHGVGVGAPCGVFHGLESN